jgi:hypothetical protein
MKKRKVCSMHNLMPSKEGAEMVLGFGKEKVKVNKTCEASHGNH